MILPDSDDTIAAISTPLGEGGIGVVRISGADSFIVVNQLINKKIDFINTASHTIHYCFIKEIESDSLMDEVLISVFKKPNSFTGENVIEISAHGNPLILNQIVELAIRHGARQAVAGEFSLRAFQNGKLDLVQAEAIADMIAAESTSAQKSAFYQLQGKLSQFINNIRKSLVEITALLEAYIDFPDEEIPEEKQRDLVERLNQISSDLNALKDSYAHGKIVRTGIQIPIIGPPNAGKSSLFNALLAEERAIVTEIPGTTRDTITETIEIKGLAVHFVDTAGLHETEDQIEALGVSRSKRELAIGSIVLLVFDITSFTQKDIENLILEAKEQNPILLFNKCDLANDDFKIKISEKFEEYDPIFISVKNLKNIDQLISRIEDKIGSSIKTIDNHTITNTRHYRAICDSLEQLNSAESKLSDKEDYELIAFDLRQALAPLEELLGKVTNEDLLSEIFGHFCIGK